MVVAVARRDGDPLDTEFHRFVEELGDLIRILTREQGAIDGDAESLAARKPDRRDGLVEHALLTDRLIVAALVAIEMDGECQIRRRLILIDVLREQDRVGTQVHELLARHDAGDDGRHLPMDGGSPPGMETTGAPQSSTALSASVTLILFCRISFG